MKPQLGCGPDRMPLGVLLLFIALSALCALVIQRADRHTRLERERLRSAGRQRDALAVKSPRYVVVGYVLGAVAALVPVTYYVITIATIKPAGP